MKKKITIFSLLILCIGAVFSADYTYSMFGGDAYINLSITGNNIYKASDTTTYFKDSVSYEWKVTDSSGNEFLWIGNTVVYSGSGNNTLYETTKIPMTCKKLRWWLFAGYVEEDSKTQTYEFKKDTESPTLSLKSGNETLPTNSNIYDRKTTAPKLQYLVSDSGSGVSTIDVYLNGSKISTSGNSIDLTNQGTYNIKIVATDNVGNRVEKSYVYIWDYTSPTLTVKNDKEKTWTQIATVSASATDKISRIASIMYSVNSGTKKEGSVVEFSETGKHKVSFTATDKAGNSVTSDETQVWIDNEKPTITVSSSISSLWAKTAIFTATGTDDKSGINKNTWMYSLDGGKSWSKENPNNNFIELDSDGEYFVLFKVKDALGNEGVSERKQVKIDTTKPTLKVSIVNEDGENLPMNSNGIYQNNIQGNINVVANDAGVGVEAIKWEIIKGNFSLNKKSETENSFSTNTSGINEIKIWVEDKVGNKSEEQTIVVDIDKESPVVYAKGDVDGDWKKKVDVEACTDDKNIKVDSWKTYYKYENDSEIVCVEGKAIHLSEHGQAKVWFEVTDLAGNITNTQKTPVKVKIDTKGPSIILEKFEDNTNSKKVIKVKVKNAEDLESGLDKSSFEYSINSGEITGKGDTAELPEGENVQIMFSVRDKVGNISYATLESLIVDVTPPSIKFLLDEYVNNVTNKLLIKQVEIVDNLSEIKSLKYSLDGNDFINANKNSKELNIDVKDLQEGNHTLKISVEDEQGNIVITEKSNFIIDRTNPEINNVKLEYDGKYIEENSFVGEKTLSLHIDAIDLYKDKTGLFNGEIVNYLYAISSIPTENLEWKYCSNNIIEIDEQLYNGLNYIFVKATDKAGNESQRKQILVNLDTQEPGSPIITSTTHKKATSVLIADRKTDGHFIIKPSFSSDAGLKTLEYVLYEGYEDGTKKRLLNSGSENFLTENSLFFSNLEDNDENTFYFLEATYIGGNGKKGSSSIYRFRIDTTPPKNLEIKIEPQILDSTDNADDRTFYKASSANISWNQPNDMTGVKEYKLDIFVDGVDVEVHSNIISRNEIINVKNLFTKEPYSGLVTIEVQAIDYVGNSEKASRSFYVDFANPEFSNTVLEISESKNNEFGRVIKWGSFTDDNGGSGIDTIVIEYKKIAENSNTQKIFIDIDSTENNHESYDLLNLQNDSGYYVKVTGYDKAGNSTTLESIFSVGNFNIEEDLSFEYNKTFENIYFYGTRKYNKGISILENIEMHLPSNIQIEKITDDEKEKFQILPVETVFDGTSIVTAQYNCKEGDVLEVTINNISFKCKGINYSREEGISFSNATVLASDLNDVNFEKLSIGFPSFIFIQSSIAPYDSKKINSGYYTVHNIESVNIYGDSIYYYGEGLCLTTDNVTLYDDNSSDEISISNVHSNITTGEIECLLKNDVYTLELSGVKYKLNKSGICDNLLNVYEATVILPEDFDEEFLTVRNFSVDLGTKEVSIQPDFNVSGISLTRDNVSIVSNSKLTIDKDGKLILSCELNAGPVYKPFSINEMNLIEFDLKNNTDLILKNCEIDLFGFKCILEKVNFINNTIQVLDGVISIYGKDFKINDLILSLENKDSVVKSCDLIGYIENDFGYGKNVLIKNIKITSEGIISEKSELEIFGSKEKRIFSGNIKSDATLNLLSKDEIELYIADYTLKVQEAVFDGKNLIVREGFINTPEGFTVEHISIENLKMNIDGIPESTKCINEQEISFNFGGWNSTLKSLCFSNEGLEAELSIEVLKNEQSLANIELWNVNFRKVLIKGDGTIVTQKNDLDIEKSMFYVNNNLFELDYGSFEKINDKYVLICDSSKLINYTVGEQFINLGKTTITPEGKITAEKANTTTAFYTTNDYIVYPEIASYNGNEIIIEGTLAPTEWSSCEFNKQQIYVYSNFFAEIKDVIPEIKYSYADWNIDGKNVVFGKNRITVGSNKVTYLGTELSLGDFEFYSSGSLVKMESNIVGQRVPIISSNSMITETRFSDEGLYSSLEIELPFVAENSNTVVFNSVHLYQNGKYFAETVIRNKELDLGNVKLSFKDLILKESGIYVDSFSINVPGLDNLLISLEELFIANNGELTLKGGATSPIQLWNMVFVVDNLAINEGEIDIQGSVQLPSSFPGALANRMIKLNAFKIGLDGTLRELDARIDGTYVIPFIGEWGLLFSSLGIGYSVDGPVILLDEASIKFPSGYGIDKVGINQVAFNPINGAFDYEKISAALSLSTEISGINFSFNELYINKEMTVGFAGSAKFVGEGYPLFLKNKEVKVNTFEITSNGSIGTIDIQLNNLAGKISPDFESLQLKDGSVKVLKKGDKDLILSVSGALEFTDKSPDFLREVSNFSGVAFRIDEFTINPKKPSIEKFSAFLSRETAEHSWSRDPKYINFDPTFLGTNLNDVYVSLEYTEETSVGEITISGGLILPDSLPEGIKGTEARINNFIVNTNGKIEEFNASYTSEKAYLGAINLNNTLLSATLKNEKIEYNIGTTLELPKEKFPEGIGGLTTSAQFVFTSDTLKEVNASVNVPNSTLMGSVKMKGVQLSLVKNQNTDMLISLVGAVILPSSMPQGLAGMEIGIQKLTINKYGEFQDIDIGASNISTTLFGQLKLSNGALNFSKGNEKDFLINITGKLAFVGSSIPAELKNTSFSIDNFLISTKKGIVSFNAGMNGNLKCTVFGGVELSLKQLSFSETGFSASASAGLKFSNVDFGQARFDAFLSMNWSGVITNFTGGLGKANVKIAGFQGKIDQLYIKKDTKTSEYYVALKECRIILPENMGSMGGESIALKDAYFKPQTGEFVGDFEIPTLYLEISGFELAFYNPTLLVKQQQINFTKVELKMPEFLGNLKTGLNSVSISASKGLSFGGGDISLPDFKVGELGFKNIGAEFVLEDDSYYITGHGGLLLPGIGELSASLSFTEKSNEYPIGLKAAYFSYEANTKGLPLGTTGLNLSGIRGGFAYGKPNDVPAKYRHLFGPEGARLSLGLTVRDGATSGQTVKMTADTWIDVTDFAMVFEGNVTILSGTFNIKGNAYAAFTNNLFATGLKFEIRFINGEVEFYVFSQNGTLKFSGSGSARFQLQKASLYDGRWVKIPTSTYSLPPVGVKFGDFTNGKRGFLGYVNIKISFINLGTVGVFVGSGGIDLKVKNYDIVKPQGFSYNANSRNSAVRSLDRTTFDSENVYKVYIPSNDGTIISTPYQTRNVNSDESSELERLARTVFVLGYGEGDPSFRIISPSGKVYDAMDPAVESTYFESGIVISVLSPEIGEWSLIVDNMEEGTYELSVLGVENIPEVVLSEPNSRLNLVSGEIFVSGTTTRKNGEVCIFAAKDITSNEIELGTLVADETGYFEGYIPIGTLEDGEYVIVARTLTHDGFYSVPSYTDGICRIDRSEQELLPPTSLNVTEISEGQIKITWENANDARTDGYLLKIGNRTTSTESVDNVGKITEVCLSGYQETEELSISVASYDKDKNTSEYSDVFEIKLGEEKLTYYAPFIENSSVTVNAVRGEFSKGEVFVNYGTHINGNEKFYFTLSDSSVYNQDIEISFGNSFVADENGNLRDFDIFVSESCLPGTYEILCNIVNENNYKDVGEFVINVQVENPLPTISLIEPNTINLSEDNTVTLFGSGFIEGTKYFLDKEELSVLDVDSNSTTMKKLSVPENIKRGNRVVKVVGPTGNEAETTLNVVAPGYDVNLFTYNQMIHAGETAVYPVKLSSFDGYSQYVEINANNVPTGFSIEIPKFEFEELEYISISTEKNVAPGVYYIEFTTGDLTFELSLEVVEEEVLPVITSILENKVYKGQTIQISGYGFKESGDLYLNDNLIDTSSWANNLISFEVPNEIETGKAILSVKNEVGYSNEIAINIVECRYSIYAPKGNIYIGAGESIEVNVAINGYAENISLSMNYDTTAPFTANLSSTTVDTNALVKVNVDVLKDAKPGLYEILITGENEYQAAESVLTISINNSFEILTKNIPTGIVGVSYDVELFSTLDKREVNWSLGSGYLPNGIKLSSDGRLFGVAEKPGIYDFEIVATNSNNVELRENYTLLINEDSWTFKGKDSGNTNSISGDIPSTDKKQWIQSISEKGKSIILGDNRVVVVTENKVFGVDDISGRILWTLSKSYVDSFISGDKLFGLTAENTFESRGLFSGLLSWSRENIESFISDGTTLILKENQKFIVIDILTGQKISDLEKCFTDSKNVVWFNGNAFEWQEKTLNTVYGMPLSVTFDSKIKNVSVDSTGFVVITDNEVLLLNSMLEKQRSIEYLSDETANIAMNSEKLVIQNSLQTVMYDRASLEVKWISYGGYKLGLANEKVIVLTSDNLKVLNGYTGKEIWNSSGSFYTFACKANSLYAVNVENIVAFNGDSNRTAPSTKIKISLEKPNGNNGWYVTQPTVSVESFDKETYVDAIMVQHNESDYFEYTGEINLQEGENKISAYGIDSKGFKGKTEELEFKFDISAPQSELSTNIRENALGWYDENVYVKLDAKDSISGIDYISVNNSKYEGTISYTEEGIYNIKWFSVDKAGNKEAEKTKTLKVDKFAPTTDCSTKQDSGITVIELSAQDSGSGINRIEYSIDDSIRKEYSEPIVILDCGWHTLSWEAFDNSGKSSGIQNLRIHVMDDTSYGKVLALAELNGENADVEILDYSSFLYTWNVSGNRYGDGIPEKYWDVIYDKFWSRNSFATLPRFILGAEYIKYKATDLMIEEERQISFYVRENAVLYMYAAPTLPVDNSWTLIDEHAHIQNEWYPEGWKLYMKRVSKGEKINVYAGTQDVAMPVIAVKEEPVVDTEITIERYASWDDSYYKGQKEFRPGILIHVDAVVNPREPEVDLPITRKWTLYINGEETELSNLWYTIPNVENESEFVFEYTIISADGKIESRAEKSITVYPTNK